MPVKRSRSTTPILKYFFPDICLCPLGYTATRDFERFSRRWGVMTGCAIIEIDLSRNPDVALRRIFT